MVKVVKRLFVSIYKSGIVGKGEPIHKVVYSFRSPCKYKEKWYKSRRHSRTEYAIEVSEVL